ncbi:chromosome partitioning protein ParB [Hylemonella gracilis str. Niagara R]|uniref:Chromosome partitioning protein ParB n=1 Tax=Hylemonella gracilis str. Niagara R TaxID=1458275 RepID=A0A016XIJ2_9BURK|nr:ParB/RepB/Spo0J family partition protein [Hylemonella gracilis]EYC51720.1 chromosome partitioning protein ParB [Hylemonella gracilis str. Niagara R]
MSATSIQLIAPSNLRESAFNYRRRFSEAGLAELTADIREVGIQQPLLVRPLHLSVDGVLAFNRDLPDRAGQFDGVYEIIFGARRFRAAQRADLIDVPCMVREIGDAEAKRLQISENLQREDVHPIEEAEGFHALMNDPEQPIDADTLAAQIGKSRSHVYGRLKLLQAVQVVRDACLAGEIGSEVALLIARLRLPKWQEQALAAIKSRYYDMKDGGKKSFRQIQELLREKFTLDLEGAIFDTQDALLVEEAGPCGSCPKLLANAPEYADLIDDNGEEAERLRGYRRSINPHTCTDPSCFEAKKKQHLNNRAAELEQQGKTVIAGNKARAAIDQYGNVKGSYIDLKDVKAELKVAGNAKKAKEALKDLPIVVLQDPRTGKTVEALAVADAQAAGIKTEPATSKNGGSYEQRQRHDAKARKQREQRAKKENFFRIELLKQVRAAVKASPRSIFDLQMIARASLNSDFYHEESELLADLWGLGDADEFEGRISDMSADDLTLLCIDCALVANIEVSEWEENLDQGAENLFTAAKHYGIDVEAMREEVGNTNAADASTEAEEEAEA